jgi:hypothetical protein
MGGQGWFGDEKLLPGERMLRRGRARLRTPSPPHWWEGSLVLTSERLIFLPDIDYPLQAAPVVWVRDIAHLARTGRNRLTVSGPLAPSIFQLTGNRGNPLGIAGLRESAWINAVIELQHELRPRRSLDRTRRAAG